MAWQDDPLVATKPKWESDPIIDAAPQLLAAAGPAIELAAGAPVPPILLPSGNPYSAGSYPMGRKYTVGDVATYRESDSISGVEQRVYTQRVTRVDEDADRVEINGGRNVWDAMGNTISGGTSVFDPPRQFVPAELQVGKKWVAAWKGTQNGMLRFVRVDFQIVRRETVTVPAGTFHAFSVEGRGVNLSNGVGLALKLWLLPGLNFTLRLEWVDRNRWGAITRAELHELVSVRQQVTGIQL